MMEASSLEESDLKGMEVCNFRGTEIALPLELIEQVFHISNSVFNLLNETGIFFNLKSYTDLVSVSCYIKHAITLTCFN